MATIIQQNDLTYATVIVGLINMIQAVTPITIYKLWAADWIISVDP